MLLPLPNRNCFTFKVNKVSGNNIVAAPLATDVTLVNIQTIETSSLVLYHCAAPSTQWELIYFKSLSVNLAPPIKRKIFHLKF